MTATADPLRASPVADYSPLSGCHDEGFAAAGEPRPPYEALIACLQRGPLARIAESVRSASARNGVHYRTADGGTLFPIDPVPRVLAAAEWSRLAAGLVQRAEALDAFVRDVYGPRRIVEAGEVPERVISGSPLYEPLMQGVEFPAGTAIHVAGPDIVRDQSAELMVLEDNLRSPSGLAYALEARRMLAAELPLDRFEPMPVEGSIELLRGALCRAAPGGLGDPRVVLLSDGPSSAGWFEHRSLARQLDIPLVGVGDLRVSDQRVWTGAEGARTPVDVIYRRTAEERLSRPDGDLTALGQMLKDPIQGGTVAVANAFGTGVADDKLAHAYVETMIRFYLGQEPMLPSVPTLDLARPKAREWAVENLDRIVVKSRGGLGGGEVEILSAADRERREHVAAMIDRRSSDFIAQQRVELSTHPTVALEAATQGVAAEACQAAKPPQVFVDRLEPRRVDLRPFVVRAVDGYSALPAALTRYAPSAESLHVNSSRGGGGKDTWVIG